MDLTAYLDEMRVKYTCSDMLPARKAVNGAHRGAAANGVIKPVLIKADGQFILCALPASHRINLSQLRMELHAEELSLASDEELAGFRADCDRGAEPPVGWLFGLPTLMDDSLFDDPRVTFPAGAGGMAVTMSFLDYYRLARPQIGHFATAARGGQNAMHRLPPMGGDLHG